MHTPETRVYLTLLTGVIVITSLVSYFIVTIIRYQKRSSTIYINKLNRDTSAADEERTRIGQDLHDDLGATLSAIKLRLNNLPVNNENDKLVIEQSKKFLKEAIARVRGISESMMPNSLQFSGLAAALNELLDMLVSPTNIQLKTNFSFELYNKNAGIHIYRMVQEIIANTVKHAAATAIQISITRNGDALHLRIADNGKGFVKRTVLKKYKGQGLRNIRARADIIHAVMYLTALRGKGVEYFFIIPDKAIHE